MSYVKYNEDDIRITDDRLFIHHGSTVSKPGNTIRYYDCKYCRKVFTDKKDLFFHIKRVHNVVRPLILINGRVASDKAIIQYVDSAQINLYGYSEDVCVGGKPVKFADDCNEIDITDLLKQALKISNTCKIEFQSISVIIEKMSLEMENNQLIADTIMNWENALSCGEELSTCIPGNLADGDKVFLKGICNYYLACSAKHDKAKRYDEAFSLLSNFNDLNGIGKCILKVISFRRNWIYRLKMLAENDSDDFKTASQFYSRQCSSPASDVANTMKALFIENETKASLEMMRLFQQGKYDELHSRLAAIQDIDNVDDLNFMDQLNLLNARMAIIAFNKKKAIEFYERLITPYFKEEYTLFKHSSMQIAREMFK